MRHPFDQLAKQGLHALLAPAGPVETEKEVSVEAQRIDVWFVPDAARAASLSLLGLLGRIAARPCAIEAFHRPPPPAALAECHRKHANLCHLLSLASPGARPPTLWILSSGRPGAAMRAYRCTPAGGWPRGIYVAPPLLRMKIVALNELPERRDTLLLRLLAAGRTLRRAIKELRALP
jgi:hypothetical protein